MPLPRAIDQQDPGLFVHRNFVRWQLRRFGAPHASLDDLSQQVWMLALDQAPSFADDRARLAWLREVCRRIAARERRQHERLILVDGEIEPLVPSEPPQLEQLRRQDEEAESDAALSELGEEQVDLLSLYGSGEMPMRVVASVVGEPEPTTYSRYRSALRDLLRIQRRVNLVGVPRREIAPPRAVGQGPISEELELAADAGQLVHYHSGPEYVHARVGNVLITRWRARMHERTAVDLGGYITRAARRLARPVVLINDAEADVAFPNARERKVLLEEVKATRLDVVAVADLIENIGAPEILVSTINAVCNLARVHQSCAMGFFNAVDDARRLVEPHAVCTHGALGWPRVQQAILSVRAVR
ncbi:MAG: sigma-70 family RNA polymerase sigma factor [Myxococcales bacterium]